MSKLELQPPLTPRDGRILCVLEIDRISTKNQDPKSNDDQEARNRRWVEDRYDGPIEWTRITGQGSGECVDRKQVLQAEEYVLTKKYDLVIMEDLGRHLRRVHAVLFCELCEDKRTRLIAINDGIDTATKWKLHAFFAAIRHEEYNKDTSERIKRSLRNRFLNGEALERPIYGYVDPPNGATHDSQRQKDPVAIPIYKEWFRRLENKATYTEIADWLVEQGVPTGPYCRNQKWDSKMVARVTHNSILKGLRQRNRRTTVRVNETGRYTSILANPDDLLERACPHLAFFEPEYYDRVVRITRTANAIFAPGVSGEDPRRDRPRKQTKWPGQHIYCGVCGSMFRYGGHGQNDHLLCRGAYEYRCWNAITVDGPDAASRIAAAVFDEISRLPAFDEDFNARLQAELKEIRGTFNQKTSELNRELAEVDHRLSNIITSLQEYGPSPTILNALRELEQRKDDCLNRRDELNRLPQLQISIPTTAEIRQIARDAFIGMAVQSAEFSRLIRQLIPRIVVFPVRLIDGGHIELRARFQLDLVPLVPASQQLPSLTQVLRRLLFVDLFKPPQREEFRERVMAEKMAGCKEREIAAKLGIAQATVQYAAALHRLMQAEDVEFAYQLLTEPPADYGKLKRHKHPRYQFKPLTQVDIS